MRFLAGVLALGTLATVPGIFGETPVSHPKENVNEIAADRKLNGVLLRGTYYDEDSDEGEEDFDEITGFRLKYGQRGSTGGAGKWGRPSDVGVVGSKGPGNWGRAGTRRPGASAPPPLTEDDNDEDFEYDEMIPDEDFDDMTGLKQTARGGRFWHTLGHEDSDLSIYPKQPALLRDEDFDKMTGLARTKQTARGGRWHSDEDFDKMTGLARTKQTARKSTWADDEDFDKMTGLARTKQTARKSTWADDEDFDDMTGLKRTARKKNYKDVKKARKRYKNYKRAKNYAKKHGKPPKKYVKKYRKYRRNKDHDEDEYDWDSSDSMEDWDFGM